MCLLPLIVKGIGMYTQFVLDPLFRESFGFEPCNLPQFGKQLGEKGNRTDEFARVRLTLRQNLLAKKHGTGYISLDNCIF